jgi:signal transduction histidine kinase
MQDALPAKATDDPTHEALAHQRYALLGSIATIIAHEFNNLMTPVLTRSQAALTYADVALMRKALDCTVSQTQRAMEICRRLLELANCQPSEPTPVQVSGAVSAVLTAAARPPEKDNIAFASQIENGVAVRADPVLFEQMLLNLLVEARQGFRKGGQIQLRARPDGDHVLIEFRVSRCRFSAQQIEGVVNPFLQRPVHEHPADVDGVGHGLAAVRTIAHLHDATLQLLPVDGGGCTLRVRWPAG